MFFLLSQFTVHTVYKRIACSLFYLFKIFKIFLLNLVCFYILLFYLKYSILCYRHSQVSTENIRSGKLISHYFLSLLLYFGYHSIPVAALAKWVIVFQRKTVAHIIWQMALRLIFLFYFNSCSHLGWKYFLFWINKFKKKFNHSHNNCSTRNKSNITIMILIFKYRLI